MKDFLFTLKKRIFGFEPEIKGGERYMLRKFERFMLLGVGNFINARLRLSDFFIPYEVDCYSVLNISRRQVPFYYCS